MNRWCNPDSCNAFLVGNRHDVALDAPSSGRIRPAHLNHVLEVDHIEEASNEDLNPRLVVLVRLLKLDAGAWVILPPAVDALIEPLVAVLKCRRRHQVGFAQQMRVKHIARWDVTTTQSTPLTTARCALYAQEAEDVSTRQLHRMQALLQTDGAVRHTFCVAVAGCVAIHCRIVICAVPGSLSIFRSHVALFFIDSYLRKIEYISYLI